MLIPLGLLCHNSVSSWIKISRILIDIIKKTCNFKAQYSIKNSNELVNKIKDIDLAKNAKFTSFAVKQIVFKHTTITFSNTIHMSNVDLIMGNPLSPMVAKIFMGELENGIHKHLPIQNFVCWYRYVDDIFACFNGTIKQLNTFKKRLGTIHQKITFTMELEVVDNTNILDLTIKK